MQNFLRAGGGGAGGRAERKQECESANGERDELASVDFLRCSGFLGELQGARQQQSCVKRTGLAARKVTAFTRA